MFELLFLSVLGPDVGLVHTTSLQISIKSLSYPQRLPMKASVLGKWGVLYNL